MERTTTEDKILVTGGTSGLGLELVKLLLDKGYYVVATGRKEVFFPDHKERYSFYRVDFGDLGMTAEVVGRICEKHEIDIVVNNAGILSPRVLTLTKDNLEYTFQINFLAHLLTNILIIRNKKREGRIRVTSVTSPVYRMAGLQNGSDSHYSAIRAYSGSKLYLALMCRHLCEIFPGEELHCFSFDPGIFGSGIYRMRGILFSSLYRIASPFMRKPLRVAEILAEYITEGNIPDGVIIDFRRRERMIPQFDKYAEERFWQSCHDLISAFIS
jgi:NAD(P)-dependent dehydrogenase (short-subunit alcohol dehydrogenase family)